MGVYTTLFIGAPPEKSLDESQLIALLKSMFQQDLMLADPWGIFDSQIELTCMHPNFLSKKHSRVTKAREIKLASDVQSIDECRAIAPLPDAHLDV